MQNHVDDQPASRTAVLARHQPVDVDNVSRTGCRLRGAMPLEVGAIGMLAVNIGGETLVELFRVSRSSALTGISQGCELGVEFLPMPAAARSLHDLAAHLDDSHAG